MRTSRALVVLVAVISISQPCFASDKVGETTYVAGTVDVYRNGGPLDEADIDFGMSVENYDTIKTGNDGVFEFELSTGRSPGTTITVDPRTSFSIDVGKVKSTETTSINMISGSLSLKVKKITGAKSVQVRTQSAVMGVRGTAFTITAPPSGQVLVTCKEGSVACTNANGAEVYATPGTAVEQGEDGILKTIPVAVSSLDQFQKNWLAEKISALRANALRAIRYYAPRYNEYYDAFMDGYRNLVSEAEILNKWAEEDKEGIAPSGSMQVMMEKKKIAGHLLRLRGTLFIFERIYYRVAELEEYHQEGSGRGTIKPGLTAAQFYGRFNEDKEALASRMALVRYATKLYALRNDGVSPTSIFEGDDDDFFGDDDDDDDDF